MELDPMVLGAFAFMITASALIVYFGTLRSVKSVLLQRGEMLNSSDAAQFPLTGSLVLFGLYIAIKFIPKEYLFMVVSSYLTLMGIVALTQFVRPFLGASIPIALACFAIGSSFVLWGHWVVNNILSIAIAVVGIEFVQLKSFKTSAILLCGLFVYDIFWVFGTDVMVTVATNIKGPIKLVVPQNVFDASSRQSLLGLGDIVIPGFFIAQMMRFSLHVSNARRIGGGAAAAKASAAFARSPPLRASRADAAVAAAFAGGNTFYFRVAFCAYIAALVNTVAVMIVFKAAQPALLWIVPWLLFSVSIAAVLRGEFRALFSYDEESQRLDGVVVVALTPEEVAAATEAALATVPDAPADTYLGVMKGTLLEVIGHGPSEEEAEEAAEKAHKAANAALAKARKAKESPKESAKESPKQSPTRRAESPKKVTPTAAGAAATAAGKRIAAPNKATTKSRTG